MPRNTTDSLRNQINRANEQSLRRKQESVGGNGTAGSQRSQAAGQRTAADASAVRTAQNRGSSAPAGMSQVTQGQQPANAAGSRSTGMERTAPSRQTAVSKTGSMQGTANRSRVDVQDHLQKNVSSVPKNTVSSGNEAVKRIPRSENAGAVPAPTSPRASLPTVQSAQPRRTPAEAAQKASPQKSPESAVQAPLGLQNKRSVPQNRSVVVPKENIGKEQAAVSRAVVGREQKSKAVSPRPSSAEMLSRTRVTDISDIQKKTAKKQKEPRKPRFEKTEVVYEDEGGNTIVSVVKAVVYMIFVIVVASFLSFAIIAVGNDVFAFVKNDVAVDVTVPEYASLDNIADILYENDVIAYPEIFKLYAQLKKDKGEFVAGDYQVSPMLNYEELLASFKEQPKVGISRITIPEGYTTDEIINLMVSYGIGTREGYIDAIQNYDFDYWFLDELTENGISEDRIYRLDGYLFPDTYDFYNSSSEVAVLNKLLKRFGQIFTEEHRILGETMGYTVDEIITIASLIEKEAGYASEFFDVSSVFHNRLKNRWNFPKLESDASIVYAIQHEIGERPQHISTSYDTPYNTYLYDGLPPGPVANPSASAMLAALSPANTEFYFFVSDGSRTYFSETKEEHDAYIEEIRNRQN